MISDSLATQATIEDNTKLALNNILQQLKSTSVTMLWPDNKQLWTENIRVSELYTMKKSKHKHQCL